MSQTLYDVLKAGLHSSVKFYDVDTGEMLWPEFFEDMEVDENTEFSDDAEMDAAKALYWVRLYWEWEHENEFGGLYWSTVLKAEKTVSGAGIVYYKMTTANGKAVEVQLYVTLDPDAIAEFGPLQGHGDWNFQQQIVVVGLMARCALLQKELKALATGVKKK